MSDSETSDGVVTGKWIEASLNAAPTSKRAKYQYPNSVVRLAVSRDDCGHDGTGGPKKEVAKRLLNSAVMLPKATRMLEARSAEIKRLRDVIEGAVTQLNGSLSDAQRFELADQLAAALASTNTPTKSETP